MAGVEHLFPGKEIIYIQVEPECDEEGFTGVEKILYIGTNYEASRRITVELQDVAELRHRTYVDNELIFESKMAYGDYREAQWVSTFDLLDQLEAEAEAAKQKLAEVTGKLLALGQL